MDFQVVDNVCRICLQRKDTLFSLFRKIQGSSPFEKLVTKTLLKIEINDPGPSSICSQCLTELDTTVHFLDKCENSNRVLSTRLKTEVYCDLGIDNNVKNYEEKVDEEHFLLGSTVVDEQLSVVENRVKLENGKDVKESLEEAPAGAAPDAAEAAECAQCGARRRCRHRAPRAHACPHCQKVFTRKFNFKLHLKRHLGEREWPCPSCGVKLLTRGLAQRHCEPRKRRNCPVPGCDKSFTSNTNLTTHMTVHTGERPHVCMECGKSFTSKNTLNGHIRIHTGAKPYICPVCGRRFTTNKLAAHLRTHSGARLACAAPACARAFATPRALRRHAAAHAAPAAPAAPAARHACPAPACAAVYAHTQSLRKHLRRRHPPDQISQTQVTQLTQD